MAGVAILLGVAVWLAPVLGPKPAAASRVETKAMLLPQVRTIIEQRCVTCHSAQLASKGVLLDTPELMAQHAQQIYQQAVVLKAMPINNATQITEAERAVLGRGYQAAP